MNRNATRNRCLLSCLLLLSLWVPLACHAANQSWLPLDATDEHYLQSALRALKMTPLDLEFKKNQVESAFVSELALACLERPLTLPAVASEDLGTFQQIDTLRDLACAAQFRLSRRKRLGAAMSPLPRLDAKFASQLPTPVARAAERIYQAAHTAQILLKDCFPSDRLEPLSAWAVSTLRLDQDKDELRSWEALKLDTAIARKLLARAEALDLQDGEIETMLLEAGQRTNILDLPATFRQLAQATDEAIAELRTIKDPGAFEISTNTEFGKIIIGGTGQNVYREEAFLIIDLGGDDIYENSAGGANGLLGRSMSIVIDVAGNDRFVSRRSFSQGSGLFGIGILADLAGDDVYEAKHLSQGAGLFGCGLLTDFGGRDKFVADTHAQGAGEFGAGILWQRGGDTTYRAVQMAQGYGSVQGFGLLLDVTGGDQYIAEGKEPCTWIAGHYFTMAQGFGFGVRPFAGGGTGILCDLKGNDRYVADVYGQGASYWYAIGMLLDAEGNDDYKAKQYCQGAGIHLSSGALIDWSGNDHYHGVQAICQGGAHDYSVGFLIDRAGDDKYEGSSTAQGSAINNSFALLLDRAGNDVYTGGETNVTQAAGHDGGKREYGSIALMLDLGGRDRYSQGQANGAAWLKPLYGCGLDTELSEASDAAAQVGPLLEHDYILFVTNQSGMRQASMERPAPVDVHHPIERQLRRAVRDPDTEEHRKDAEATGEELRHLGTEALGYLLTRVDCPDVIVRVKAEELVDLMGTNSVPLLIDGIRTAKNDDVARLCCYILARFDTATNAIPYILPLLQREKTRVTALYTLGHLRAREAFTPALAALTEEQEMVRLRATQALGRIGDKRATEKLITALDDELWDVRYAAEDALVAFGYSSRSPLRSAYATASPRTRPHIIEALARLGDRAAVPLARRLYRLDDAQVREAVMRSLTEQLTQARAKH